MNKACTLYRVKMTLGRGGWSCMREIWKGEELHSYYSVLKEDWSVRLSLPVTQVYKFDGLMNPLQRDFDTYKLIERYVWCLPDQESEAKELLKSVITKATRDVETQFNKLLKSL